MLNAFRSKRMKRRRLLIWNPKNITNKMLAANNAIEATVYTTIPIMRIILLCFRRRHNSDVTITTPERSPDNIPKPVTDK
jgi:hypothetical protein